MLAKKFVVLTRGRTGSTAIVDEIDGHPEIMCHQELFLPGSDGYGNIFDLYMARGEIIFKRGGYRACPFPLFLRVHMNIDVDNWNGLSPVKRGEVLYTYWMYVASRNTRDTKALGYKMMLHHDEAFHGALDYLERNSFSIIYLKRNPARMVISGMVAKQRNLYNSLEKNAIKAPLHLDVAEFEKEICNENSAINQELEYVRNSRMPFIEVDYETYLTDRSAFFSGVFNFLGVSSWEPKGSDYQVQIDDLRQTISNYDELAAVADKIGSPVYVQ